MEFTKLLMASFVLAAFPLQSWAQDTSARTLQGWLDFLGQDPSLASVFHRIGDADKEKNVDKIASHARMYVWYGRFENDTGKNDRLDLVAAPDEEPDGPHMIVIAVLDPVSRRGIYLPWAWRYVDDMPRGTFIPHVLMQALID